jgi:hypothetical protein
MFDPTRSTISRIAYVSLGCALTYVYVFGNPGLDRRSFAYTFGIGSVIWFLWTYLLFRKRNREVVAKYPEFLPADRSSRRLGRYGIITFLAAPVFFFGSMSFLGPRTFGFVIVAVLFGLLIVLGTALVLHRLRIVLTQIVSVTQRER